MENNYVDWKRVGIFSAFAFGIAWLVALVLYLTGGPEGNPYTLLLLAVGYMGTPRLRTFSHASSPAKAGMDFTCVPT